MPNQPAKVVRPLGPRVLRPWADALALAALRKEPNGQTRLNRIAERTVRDAMNGDKMAMREIGERLDGRVNLQPDDVGDKNASMQTALITTLLAELVDRKRASEGDSAKVIDGTASIATMVESKLKE